MRDSWRTIDLLELVEAAPLFEASQLWLHLSWLAAPLFPNALGRESHNLAQRLFGAQAISHLGINRQNKFFKLCSGAVGTLCALELG
jgi:hypothetical protein